MERVGKFFIPYSATAIDRNIGAFTTNLACAEYVLPTTFFPLPPNQSLRFSLLNLRIDIVPGTLQANFIGGQLQVLASLVPYRYIVSFPAFPLTAAPLIASPIGSPPASLVLPIVNAGWEWDSFMAVGFSPRSLLATFSFSATTAGGVKIGFEGIYEIWRL